MVKFRALFFLLLVLVLSVAPAMAGFQANMAGETACTDHCCGSLPADSGSENDTNGVCNPFQCHTCCFMVVPAFAIDSSLSSTSLAVLQVPHFPTYRFSVLHDVWQPPRHSA